MDEVPQQNHLKAYGITFWCLEKNYKSELVTYIVEAPFVPDAEEIRKECQIRGVSFEIISDAEELTILNEISSPSQNMESVCWKST
jgi:hypothetical protein